MVPALELARLTEGHFAYTVRACFPLIVHSVALTVCQTSHGLSEHSVNSRHAETLSSPLERRLLFMHKIHRVLML
jgi:hypothetical protein